MSHYNCYVPFKLRSVRTVVIVVLCLSVFVVFNMYKLQDDIKFEERDVNVVGLHKYIVDRFYESHKSLNTSKLGTVLYKNEEYPEITEENRNKTFVILIWKHMKILEQRHIYYFGSTRKDPLSGCSVSNCEFTGNDAELETADAVVVHLHRGDIPEINKRNPKQKWIFLNDEAPPNVFRLAKHTPTYADLHNVFNWSMTYLSEADIPVPYGRTVALKKPKFSNLDPPLADIIPNWKEKTRDVLAAILLSNCVAYRMKLIKELKEYIKVDVHGQCADNELRNSCPGHFRSDCKVLSKYLFYLVLENSSCKEYMTEKLFYNAYSRGAIPIIYGPTIEECRKFLPPNSYLHIENYESVKDLAEDIVNISNDEKKLLYFHKWRNHFETANEHGYFGSKSFHLCRLCEAMNYNDHGQSIYTEQDLRQFLDKKILCRD